MYANRIVGDLSLMDKELRTENQTTVNPVFEAVAFITECLLQNRRLWENVYVQLITQ